jgi:hypothetical protein
MKGARGCEHQTTFKQLLPKFRSRLFTNQGIHFILHSSFFILHHTNSILQLAQYCADAGLQ